MALSVSGCYAHIKQTLRGRPSDEIQMLDLVNMAGEYLVGMNAWKWLERPAVPIGVTAGQDWAPLPEDFDGFIAQEATRSLVNTIRLVGFQELLRARTNEINLLNFNYYGALEHADSTAPGGGPPVQRLALWPTPSVTRADEFTIFYRARWKNVCDDTENLTLAEHCEPLYLTVLRAFARGWDREDQAELNQRLLAAAAGPLFEAAKMRDSRSQQTYGPIRGGAAADTGSFVQNFARTTVAEPS